MLGAAARATGLIGVAVAVGILLLQYSDDSQERLSGGRVRAGLIPATGVAPTTTSTTAGPRAPAELTVLVLNASGRANQAKPMSDRLEVVGYRTLEPGNAARRPDTAVLCRPGFEREASDLVAATGLPATVEQLSPEAALPGAEQADCVVIIGSR
jgi:LytR cell envelope-related transcriptional attenuator